MTWLAATTALWLGLLTAVSPCPLTTNIAAISFIGRQVGSRRRVLLSGMMYVAGRTLVYVLLGLVLTAGILAADDASRFLQKYMNEFLGPVLIILGMVLLGLIGSASSWNLVNEGVQQRAARGGLLWALILGVLFALSFCPVSAGLFFAGLVPLAVKAESRILLPTVYGVGTALPVLAFAFLIAFSAERLGRAFDMLSRMERWVRATVGLLFIGVGVYYCLVYVYGVHLSGN